MKTTLTGPLLVTGATGSVGVEVLRNLLARRHGEEVRLLIRASHEGDLQQRWQRLLACASEGALSPADVPQMRPVRGDVTKPDMGVEADRLPRLQDETAAILHIAANVNFDEDLETSRAINVEGTRSALQFAERCPNLQRFGHVSSLYVAGRRTGVVRETDLVHDAGFVTFGYEQSKYEAELLVQQYMDRLPLAIYRLSLLLGREEDGYVHDFGAIHRFLQFAFQGICPCLPGKPDCPLDFLPNDYTARCLMTLFIDRFAAGTTYQISSNKKSITAQRWMELTAEVYAQHSEKWRKGVCLAPDVVEWDHYRLYVKTVDTIDNPALRKVTRVLDSCAEELFCPKVFDRSVLDRTLGTGLEAVPDYEQFYPRILEYCISSGWGRNPRFAKV